MNTDLFGNPIVIKEKKPVEEESPVVTLIGGIYRDDNDEPDYDGCYALTMGSNAFCFLFDGMDHIENEVELACAHHMRLVKGYALCINKGKKKWQIRNSSIKGQPGYIIAEGNYNDGFVESLKPILKVFHK
jgi:hypothetical protein